LLLRQAMGKDGSLTVKEIQYSVTDTLKACSELVDPVSEVIRFGSPQLMSQFSQPFDFDGTFILDYCASLKQTLFATEPTVFSRQNGRCAVARSDERTNRSPKRDRTGRGTKEEMWYIDVLANLAKQVSARVLVTSYINRHPLDGP